MEDSLKRTNFMFQEQNNGELSKYYEIRLKELVKDDNYQVSIKEFSKDYILFGESLNNYSQALYEYNKRVKYILDTGMYKLKYQTPSNDDQDRVVIFEYKNLNAWVSFSEK